MISITCHHHIDSFGFNKIYKECIVHTLNGISQAEGTLNSKLIKPVALDIVELHLTKGISQAVSQ